VLTLVETNDDIGNTGTVLGAKKRMFFLIIVGHDARSPGCRIRISTGYSFFWSWPSCSSVLHFYPSCAQPLRSRLWCGEQLENGIKYVFQTVKRH